MHQMLDTVDGHRRGHADYLEESLHPQDVLAVGTQQHREPDAERRPVERAVDCHAERVDVAVVRADMTGSHLRRRGRRRGLEPAPRLLPRAGRIGGVTGEELVWLNRMDRGLEDRRGRIQATAGGSERLACARPARSVLVRTTRSATATCFTDSGCWARCLV